MEKIQQLINILKSEEVYVNKIDIYDGLMEFIDYKDSLNLEINSLLNELFISNIDKFKYYLRDKELLELKIYERNLTDEDVLMLLKEYIKYEKRYLR